MKEKINKQDEKIAADLAPVFSELRALTFRSDPFLSSKVLARRQQAATVPLFWKWLGLGSSGLSVSMALLLFFLWHAPKYEAFVGKPFVVKLEILDLEKLAIARADIRLPDGVYFDLDQYPELKTRRTLSLAWSNRQQKEFIPFVLTATSRGKKTIIIDFYDQANLLIGSKKIVVELRPLATKG